MLGMESTDVVANQALKPGNYQIVYDFKYDGGGPGKGGLATITVGGNKVAEKRIERTQPGIFSVDDLADVGIDDGTWVADYGTSSDFSGTINYVTISRN
jgi:arylsulfatase